MATPPPLQMAIDTLSIETAETFKSLIGNEQGLRQAVFDFIANAKSVNLSTQETEDILGINEPCIMDMAQLSSADEEIIIDAFESYINETTNPQL